MPSPITLYRVLIASPGDVARERDTVTDAIHSWNSLHGDTYGVRLEPVRWETHARPEMGDRAQGAINRQLVDQCDILIGTFWTRLGTDTGVAPSGTAEEIGRFEAAGKQIMLYFSSMPVDLESIDFDQYESLKKYRAEMEKKGLISRYSDISNFRDMVSRDITRLMRDIISPTVMIETAIVEKNKVKSESETKSNGMVVFKSQYQKFIRRFELEWVSERDSEPYDTDTGKTILSGVMNYIMSFLEQGIDIGEESLSILKDTVRYIRILIRHQTFIDGGVSFKEFWDEGDKVLHNLSLVLENLDSESR